jgi:DNA repair exonuclease SbcCD nuclease subunit
VIRFIHSADWQLGARFRQFGAKGETLRQARLQTLRRALELARKHEVDAFLIAGDLFEDNQVEESLVASVVASFGEFPSVPVYILPGNHDPISGPESVWRRKAFRHPPANVHVLMEPGVTSLGAGAFLLASPLSQKSSTIDPSLKLATLAADLPPESTKIGITHGALAIESKHQPNDFPIALNAATRAGLDYLAIGHWHSWLHGTDSARIHMPGTPEPDQFGQEGSGHVALVEIGARPLPPKIERLPVATLQWRSLIFDFLSLEASNARTDSTLAELLPNAAQVVLRITLTGTVSPLLLQETRAHLEEAVRPFLVGQILDHTTVALTAAELDDLRLRHPILAQVLADIDRLETLATGVAGAVPVENEERPLTLSEAQQILAESKIDLASLPPEFFTKLRQVLLQTLQEVAE